MSVETNYTCDKCGNVQHKIDQFWRVGVMAMPYSGATNRYQNFTLDPLEVCRDCLEAFGIYPQKKTLESPTYNPPTLEELIIEIVQRELDP